MKNNYMHDWAEQHFNTVSSERQLLLNIVSQWEAYCSWANKVSMDGFTRWLMSELEAREAEHNLDMSEENRV